MNRKFLLAAIAFSAFALSAMSANAMTEAECKAAGGLVMYSPASGACSCFIKASKFQSRTSYSDEYRKGGVQPDVAKRYDGAPQGH